MGEDYVVFKSSFPLSASPSDDFPIFTGTLLGSSHRIQTFLGEGGFGYVAKCEDTQTKKSVAVKICKKHPTSFHQAQKEVVEVGLCLWKYSGFSHII